MLGTFAVEVAAKILIDVELMRHRMACCEMSASKIANLIEPNSGLVQIFAQMIQSKASKKLIAPAVRLSCHMIPAH